MGELLIAGIDPGTQSAYVLLSLSGDLVKVGSGRNLSPEQLIREISSFGKIVVVGTDVTPAPFVVKKVARVLGARVVEPDRNLQFHEKIKIVDEFLKKQKEFVNLENKHEKDALCAALTSLKKTNSLLKKIEDTLKQQQLLHLNEQVREKVLLENLPIAHALNLLMKM